MSQGKVEAAGVTASLAAGTGLRSVRVFFSEQILSVLPTPHLLSYPKVPVFALSSLRTPSQKGTSLEV